MKHDSLVLIDSKFRGKTISYAPALCSLIQMHLDNENNADMMGAYAIVLCPNSSSVENTAKLCQKLLSSNKKSKVVHAIGSREISSVVVSTICIRILLVSIIKFSFSLVESSAWMQYLCNHDALFAPSDGLQ